MNWFPIIENYDMLYINIYEKMKNELSDAGCYNIPGLNVRFGPFKLVISTIQRKKFLKKLFVMLDNNRLENKL